MRGLPLILPLLIFAVPACRDVKSEESLPPHWARPVKHDGIKKLVIFKWNDVLYHSAQPRPGHFKVFKEMGIRAVVNVREIHDDRAFVEPLGLKYYRLPISAWSIKQQQIIEFLRLTQDPANQPLLVYCWFGGERSNMLCAAYRVAVEGWSKEEAVREMTQGGHHYQSVWWNVVQAVYEMDVERVRRLAGIEPIQSGAGAPAAPVK